MTKLNDDGTIAILTIYTPQEALYYFMDEGQENPDTATVIKRIKYDKSPVIRMEYNPKQDNPFYTPPKEETA